METNIIRGFLQWGYPQIIHLNTIFHYKPSSDKGVPTFTETANSERDDPPNCAGCPSPTSKKRPLIRSVISGCVVLSGWVMGFSGFVPMDKLRSVYPISEMGKLYNVGPPTLMFVAWYNSWIPMNTIVIPGLVNIHSLRTTILNR